MKRMVDLDQVVRFIRAAGDTLLQRKDTHASGEIYHEVASYLDTIAVASPPADRDLSSVIGEVSALPLSMRRST